MPAATEPGGGDASVDRAATNAAAHVSSFHSRVGSGAAPRPLVADAELGQEGSGRSSNAAAVGSWGGSVDAAGSSGAASAQRRASLRAGSGVLQRALSSSSAGRMDPLRRVCGARSSVTHHDIEAAYCADAGSIEEQPSEIERAASLASSEAAITSPRSPARSRRKISVSSE